MPFPCRAHAVPLRVWNVSFPFDLHSAAVSDSHLLCRTHAMLSPCRSSQGHGTVRPSRRPVGCQRSASGYHSEFQENCYQKHTDLRCRWPVWNPTFIIDEEKLIILVQEHECLYNLQHNNYDNMRELWRSIRIFNHTVFHVDIIS